MMEGISIEKIGQIVDTSRLSIYRGVLMTESTAADRASLLFDEPLRIDALALVLCTKGRGRITCSLQSYDVEEGMLLLIPPKSILTTETGEADAESRVLLLDPRYLSDCNLNIKKLTSSIMRIMQNPCVRLTQSEFEQYRGLWQLLRGRIDDRAETEFRDDIVRSLVEAITYFVFELFLLHIEERQPLRTNGVSVRLDEYFHRFLHELSQHYLERRSVAFYADRLCISSRYLTTIVRRVSGLSVSEWMNRYLMMEAKYLLKYSEMSIQEIAYKLSFPNQSFFGKFFKQHAGTAPSAFRARQ